MSIEVLVRMAYAKEIAAEGKMKASKTRP